MSSSKPAPRTTPTREVERYAAYRNLSFVYEGRSERLEVRAPDLSSRGMFIHTPRHFNEGAIIKLDFQLTRSGYQVHCRGEVRYCLSGVGIGVEFVDISQEAQQAVEDEIRQLMGL